MPKNNLDIFSFVKARGAQKTADAIGGDFSAFITQVRVLAQLVSTLQTTVNDQSQTISTLQTTVNAQSQTISTLQTALNNLKQGYEQHTHGYTYPDATNYTTTTHN